MATKKVIPVFKTSLKRLEKIENLKRKSIGGSYKWYRAYNLYQRLETILNEMYYKRILEPEIKTKLRQDYIYINEECLSNYVPAFLNEEFLFSLELSKKTTLYIDAEQVLPMIRKTWVNVCKEIESHNHKLFSNLFVD